MPYDEAFDRLYGSGKTINSNSTSDELPDGYEWNEKKNESHPQRRIEYIVHISQMVDTTSGIHVRPTSCMKSILEVQK